MRPSCNCIWMLSVALKIYQGLLTKVLPMASQRLLCSIMWQVGSETECLRVSLPRDPSVSCQLPRVHQKSQRVLSHQTCHTSARLEWEEIRHRTHLIWGAVYTHRGAELVVIWKSAWFSCPQLSFLTEIMTIILCYDHVPAWLMQWKEHWIQWPQWPFQPGTNLYQSSSVALRCPHISGWPLNSWSALMPSNLTPDENGIKPTYSY